MKRIKIEETDSWQKPILSISNNGTATKGNRYIVGDTPTGEFSGFSTDSILTYDGTAWLEDVPEKGWTTYDLDQDKFLLYQDSSWNDNSLTASNVITDTTNFDNNLSAADDTVQKALETIDDLITSGGGTLDDLSDVNTSGVTDGQALVYDSGSGTWIPGTIAIGSILSLAIGEMSGTIINALSNFTVSITIT